jgi:23S rRNA-/tRNA-specific pseudouridylate synthase
MRVVYADPWLMVVDKPSGLLSQSGLGPDLQDAVPGRLRAAWGELRLVHRLDRDTSGLLLLARDADAHQLRVHLAWLGHPILGDPLYGHARSRALGVRAAADPGPPQPSG